MIASYAVGDASSEGQLLPKVSWKAIFQWMIAGDA